MEMYHYIFLALLLPGFISHCIYVDLTRHKKVRSQVEEIVNILVYSIIIFIISHLIIICYSKIDDINTFQIQFKSMWFTLKYILFIMFISISVGFFWGIFEEYIYMHNLNNIRDAFSKTRLQKVDSLVQSILDTGKTHVIEIKKQDGTSIVKGFLANICYYDATKEFYVKYIQHVKDNDKFFGIEQIDGIYYDLNSGIQIIDYKLDLYDKYMEELQKQNNNVNTYLF